MDTDKVSEEQQLKLNIEYLIGRDTFECLCFFFCSFLPAKNTFPFMKREDRIVIFNDHTSSFSF